MLTAIVMKRSWAVALFVLGAVAALTLWHLLASTDPAPDLALTPPAIAPLADEPPVSNPFGAATALPKELSSESFYKMLAAFSEPDGYFMYENYLSNERSYQEPIPSLVKKAQGEWRLYWRRPGAKLHVHRGDSAGYRIHHRYSASEHD